MKKTVLFFIAIAQISFIFAQSSAAPIETSPKFKPYGNVRFVAFYNSRQMEDLIDGLALVYPKQARFDAFGKDLNSNSTASFSASATRLGLDLLPFRLGELNMNLSGKIEADFLGSANFAFLRLRHAFVNMNFGKSDILAGMSWHPLYENSYPLVADLNAGMPYLPFARNPQLRYSYSTNGLKLYGVAIAQTQFSSLGPEGRTPAYQRNAKLPELVAGAEYEIDAFIVSAAIGHKQLRPRITAETENGTISVNEKIGSTLVSGFIQYKHNLLTLKTKTTYGEDLNHLNMLGGYAVTSENERGERSYKPFNTIASWISADYIFGKNSPFAINIFGGYSKNLGVGHSVLGAASDPLVYGRVMHDEKMISEIWHGSANLMYSLKNWRLSLEYGYNKAFYGDFDISNGKALNTTGIDGSRVLAALMLMF